MAQEQKVSTSEYPQRHEYDLNAPLWAASSRNTGSDFCQKRFFFSCVCVFFLFVFNRAYVPCEHQSCAFEPLHPEDKAVHVFFFAPTEMSTLMTEARRCSAEPTVIFPFTK